MTEKLSQFGHDTFFTHNNISENAIWQKFSGYFRQITETSQQKQQPRKIVACHAWLRNKVKSSLHSRYSEEWKSAAPLIKMSKMKWLGCRDRAKSCLCLTFSQHFNYCQANKVFWQTIRCLRDKRSDTSWSKTKWSLTPQWGHHSQKERAYPKISTT